MALDFKGISEFDKEAFALARDKWKELSSSSQRVEDYIQKERGRLDPGSKDYLTRLRTLELLKPYNSIADGNGGTVPKSSNPTGHKSMMSALEGRSPSGNVLESQTHAAKHNMPDVMGEKMKKIHFHEDFRTKDLIPKSRLGGVVKVAMGATAAFGAISAAHAENPQITTFEMAKVGGRAIAEQSIPGQAEANRGDSCGMVGSFIGWTSGLVAGAGVAAVGTPTTSPLISIPLAIGTTAAVENAVTPAATESCRRIKNHFGM